MFRLKRCSAIAAGVALAALASGCDDALEPAECDRLLERYTERLILEEHPETPPQELEQRKTEARDLARRDKAFEFDRCASLVSRRQFECAMNAPTVDDIERCLTL